MPSQVLRSPSVLIHSFIQQWSGSGGLTMKQNSLPSQSLWFWGDRQLECSPRGQPEGLHSSSWGRLLHGGHF